MDWYPHPMFTAFQACRMRFSVFWQTTCHFQEGLLFLMRWCLVVIGSITPVVSRCLGPCSDITLNVVSLKWIIFGETKV